jgi:Tfp pilus assembly PilM family ATPase
MWEPCLACSAQNSAAERFCAGCGVELAPAVIAAIAALDATLQAATLLADESKLLEAIEQLSTIVPSEHGRLAERVREATRLREDLSARRQQIVTNLFERVAEAQHLADDRQFAAALATLEQIPASLRNQQARTLLAEMQTVVAEIRGLRRRVAESLKAGGSDDLFAQVTRLRELEPQAADIDTLWRKLAAKQQELNASLGKKLLKRARDAIVVNDYRTADACLKRMPQGSVERSTEIADAIAERVWLFRQVSTAPFADRTLLDIATRLVKVQPKDDTAKLWLSKIQERLARMKPELGAPLAPWVKPTALSSFGAPVTPVESLANLNWDTAAIESSSGTSDLRRQLTAVGLALVGLGKARLDLDLRPDRTSWLERLAEVRNLGRNTVAWGIDLGSSGIKYVRLATNKAGEVRAEQAGVIPFPAADRLKESTDLPLAATAALEEFIERHKPASDPVIVGLPGSKTLGRCFLLPRLKPARRFQKLLEYEIRNQIPLPLDEVVYGAHVWEGDPSDESAESHARVTVAAAKRSHIDIRLSPLTGLEWRLASLQSECAALLNVLHFSFADKITQLQTGQSIALVEVGDDSTNIALAGRQGSCFRAVHQGVRSLDKPLARARGITIEQADQLRHEWRGAEAIHRLDADLAPALDELTRAVRHALDTCDATLGTQVAHVYVAGGGCYQYGLLRNWSLSDRPAETDQTAE